MIQSMTGFGAAEGPWGGGHLMVEVRSVNHRFFNPTLKLPGRLQRWEGDIRESLRSRVGRGHVTLLTRLDSAASTDLTVNEARAVAYAGQLRSLRDRLGLAGDVELSTLLRLPDVVRASDEADAMEEGTAEELLAIVGAAVDALVGMRTAEGERLAAELHERLAVLDAAHARIAERAPGRLAEQRDRLRANVRELLDGGMVDEQRLAQEIALLAERLDVQEEIARFGGHVAAFRETISAAGNEPVGKRLGFLLQEMLREANTTGSKANDAAIVADVLVIKEELERLREQVENVE